MNTKLKPLIPSLWLQVADGSAETSIIMQNTFGSCVIYVSDDPPEFDTLHTFALTGRLTLPGNAKVWARGTGFVSVITI